MDKDTSQKDWRQKPLGPAWAIAIGGVVLGISIAVLAYLIYTVKSGETWNFSERHPGLVSRENSPGSFWTSVCFSSGVILMLARFGVVMLRDGFRGLRK